MDLIGMACKALVELVEKLTEVLPLRSVTEVVAEFVRAISAFENNTADLTQRRLVRVLVPDSDPLILVCAR